MSLGRYEANTHTLRSRLKGDCAVGAIAARLSNKHAQSLNFKAAIRDFCFGHLGAMETSCKHWNTISIKLIWRAWNLAAAYLHIQWSSICIHLESSFWPLGQCKVQYSLPFSSFFSLHQVLSKVYRYLAAYVVAIFLCLSFVAGAVSIQWGVFMRKAVYYIWKWDESSDS